MTVDLSPGSAKWWEQIKEDALNAYMTCMKGVILKKLEVMPVLKDKPQYTRLKAKAASLMLDAIPRELAEEAASAREIHPTQILFAVMKKFQAG